MDHYYQGLKHDYYYHCTDKAGINYFQGQAKPNEVVVHKPLQAESTLELLVKHKIYKKVKINEMVQ